MDPFVPAQRSAGSSGVLASIDRRRARRAISAEPLDRNTVETLFRAAHLAPSCANNQPWRFVAVDDPTPLTSIKEHLTSGNYWADPAPLIVGVASRADLDCEVPDGRTYHLFGCGLAVMNLMLQATHLGLIAHPIAGFKQKAIKAILELPSDFTLIALVIVGRPGDPSMLSTKHRAEESASRERKPLEHVVSWNRYAAPSETG